MSTTAPLVLDLRVEGMDCPGCASNVTRALQEVTGVLNADVRLTTERALVEVTPGGPSFDDLEAAVSRAGYRLLDQTARTDGGSFAEASTAEPASSSLSGPASARASGDDFARRAVAVTGLAFGAVLFVIVVGEWLGLFQVAEEVIPFPIGVAIALIVGYPALRGVVRAALSGRVVAHTLMSVGLVAALVVGQWVTAAVVAFFMRVGDAVERFTVQRGRRALMDLERMAPETARREGPDGEPTEVRTATLRAGDIVQVRPGDRIPADGEVLSGRATVEQAAITGESMPTEVVPGSRVFAATLARGGALRVRVDRTGAESTFGRIVRLVEEAEGRKGRVEQFADRFSGRYLPIVSGVALLTFVIGRDPLATAAVLVVACSCAFALATPIAMLATIGAAARRGLVVKGGRFIEALAKPGVLLLDKTGTLTLGRPEVGEIVLLGDAPEAEVLKLAAATERTSEHPLGEAIVREAKTRGIEIPDAEDFRSMEGKGVTALVGGRRVWVGGIQRGAPAAAEAAARLGSRGMTAVHVYRDGKPLGVVGLADKLRPDARKALDEMRALGFGPIEILTGDSEAVAKPLADALGVSYRSGLLPEDKLRVVEEYQARGLTVVMVGDGVNDAPALAQADVGVAMGATGTDLALEVADVALLRDDWSLLPEAVRTARRTMRVVRGNFAFTAAYNVVGLSLAAFGILPPIAAAAAQSIPDIGILGNSARLLRR